ncbi:MAG: Rieske 2Fe-2S domain-containing protein [Actinomycetota bacterium]|nr:Rieske 2Fe-2S domain-containing protein [Actinomycetota bacterium]
MRVNVLLERLIARVEVWPALDKIADPLASAVAVPLRSRRLRSWTAGSPLGHSAHPMLVSVPIGAFVAASGLDLLAGEQAGPAAERLIGIGILSALPTAITGASDWSYTTGAERRVGIVHAIANWVAIAGYTASWQARRSGRRRRGVLLAAGSAAVLSLAGWLGGHLVYARGVGVDTTAFLPGVQEWTEVLADAELAPSKPTQVRVGGVPILLVRLGDRLLAVDDRCSHRGGPLHEGSLTGDCISCPWHGGTFDLTDGSVLSGPPTRPQRHWDVRVQAGSIQLRTAEEPGSLRQNPTS